MQVHLVSHKGSTSDMQVGTKTLRMLRITNVQDLVPQVPLGPILSGRWYRFAHLMLQHSHLIFVIIDA